MKIINRILKRIWSAMTEGQNWFDLYEEEAERGKYE